MWRFAVGEESRRFGARCSGLGNASDRRGGSLFTVITDNTIWKGERKKKKNSLCRDREESRFGLFLRHLAENP